MLRWRFCEKRKRFRKWLRQLYRMDPESYVKIGVLLKMLRRWDDPGSLEIQYLRGKKHIRKIRGCDCDVWELRYLQRGRNPRIFFCKPKNTDDLCILGVVEHKDKRRLPTSVIDEYCRGCKKHCS